MRRVLALVLPVLLLMWAAGCRPNSDADSQLNDQRPATQGDISQPGPGLNSSVSIDVEDVKQDGNKITSEGNGENPGPPAADISEENDRADAEESGLIARSANADLGSQATDEVLDSIDRELQELARALDSVQADLGEMEREEAE